MPDSLNKADRNDGLCYHGWILMWAGGLAGCVRKKLRDIGTSSEHNEYMGIFYTSKFIVWMRQLLEEMGWNEYVRKPVVLFGDNVCANRLCKGHVVSTRNQHIYVPYHWVRQAVRDGHIEIKWTRTECNLSDVFTKAVPLSVVRKLVRVLTGHGSMVHFQQMLEANLDLDANKMIHSKN